MHQSMSSRTAWTSSDFIRSKPARSSESTTSTWTRPLIGYTGRHGYEKRLEEIITAADGMDVTLVFGGDGPARKSLEKQAPRSATWTSDSSAFSNATS